MTGRSLQTAACAALYVTVMFARASAAQQAAWEDKAFLGVNVGVQPLEQTFTESTSPVINGEPAAIVVPLVVGRSPLIDVAAGVRVWKNFGVAAGFSRFSTSNSSTLTARIPNPLLFNQLRSASAPIDNVAHTETAVHLEMLWTMPLGPDFDVMGVVGGSMISVSQDVVTGLTTTEGAAPFTTVTIASTQTQTLSKMAPALTVGADLTYRFTRQFGAGIFARYSRVSGGRVHFDDPGGSGDIPVGAGGPQFGIGLRARF